MSDTTAFYEELDKTYVVFDKMYDEMVKLAPELEPEFTRIREDTHKKRQERRDLIARCHPDGVHWPPHHECPACVKLLERVEKIATERCKNPENEQEREQKFEEVFREMYGRRKD